jgi:uncharacterized membrane-anchored protein
MSALVFSAIWLTLISFALYLITLRSDKIEIYSDWNKFLNKPKSILWFVFLILIFVVLPTSIPFSLSHIEKTNKNNE